MSSDAQPQPTRQAVLADALMPFQRDGVTAALGWNGRILLGDEMGLGKTLQAIAIAVHYAQEWPLLVLCPTSMALTWCEELERWCPSLAPGDINLVKSQHNGRLRDAKVTILTYGLVTNGKERERLAQNVVDAGFRVAIADEAHYLKSKDAQRTKLVMPMLTAAKRCIVLTGTPALNRPVELFTLLQCIAPKQPQWRTYTGYTERYCAAKMVFFGRQRRLDVKGSSNEAELHGLLTSTCMVRRLKVNVLKQLPAKRRQRVIVELPPAARRALDLLQRDSAKLRASSDDPSFAQQQLLTQMCVELGNAKAQPAAEYALELLPSCEKLLFFAHHKVMLDAMEQAAAAKGVRCLRIDGATPASERQALVKAFQALPAGTQAVFALSILAAGQGLTLTAAHTVVFGELRWVPGELLQAEDRAHRIGQTTAVNCHYVLAKDSVDEAMWRALQRKVRSLGQTLDGQKTQLQADMHSWKGGSSSQDDAGAPDAAPDEDAPDAADGSCAGEAVSLLEERARREKEAKLARKRGAFSDLFARAKSTSTSGSSASTSSAAAATGGAGVIDLSGDDDMMPAGASEGFASQPSAEEADARGWFAVSSLTGRLHAFGLGATPTHCAANALPSALQDEDTSQLPAELAEPRMLRAAQRWLFEWDTLTPAAKAALHDTPVRPPLINAAANPSTGASRKSVSITSATAAKGGAVAASSSGSGSGCGGSSGSTSASASGSASASASGSGSQEAGSQEAGSTQRETSAERWAETHRPATPHTTATWTSGGAIPRTWVQHFSMEQDGKPHCVYCLAIHSPQPDSPFCSEGCAASFFCASSQGSARRQLFERDRGVCQQCGFDAHSLYLRIAALQSHQARMQALMSSHYSTLGDRTKRMLNDPKGGDFWEADHVVAVAEGGGESDLNNFQTLCVPCHAKKTGAQKERSKAEKRSQAAAGTRDVRSFFTKQPRV